MSDDDRFTDSPVSRRRFVQLSAATGAALSLPGNATASVDSDAFTAEYQYVLNHTPEDYRAPTLVTFSGPAGLEAFETLGFGEEVHTTTTPQNAAYAQLTTAEAQQVADLPEADSFQFSPGSNPFWRIGYYPLGVFPEPRRSVDFIGFEQLKDGLAELEDRYPDRVNVREVGRSPGHTNNLTDRPDPKEMIVVEVTNDVQDRESFREKEKVFHSCSLHGLEAAGRETGARVVENVARGSEPDIEGNNAKIEPLLDDAVLLIGFTNPDGWAVRNPQYDSGWQVGGPGSPIGAPRVPAAPLYERGNAEVYDTNRQYPIVGVIDPTHYPAYVPEDAGPDDVPSFVHEKVPDAAAFVEFFREYENLNYGSDLHGGPIFNEFVLGLISQDQFDTRELHELYEMCLVIDETLTAALDRWQTAGDIRTELIGGGQYDPLLFGVLPEQAFDYATIYDTIGYTVSGAMLDWMAHPEPVGIDMTTLDFEMSFSHMTGGNVYNPELLEMEVTGYRTAIRTITAFAVRNSNTPNTADSFQTTTKSGGDRVAYVTSGRDALRRTHEDLEFEDGDDTDSTSSDSVTVADRVAAEEATTVSHEVADADLHSLRIHIHAEQAVMDAELESPSGEVVRSFDGVTEDRVGGKCCGFPEWVVTTPEPGEWTLRLENRREVAQGFEAYFGTFASQSTNPDPRSVEQWGGEGYEQLEYDVEPYQYFEDYDGFIDDGGSIEELTVSDIAGGALLDAEGNLRYDHVVAVHDYGANEGADYLGSEDVPGYTPADHPEPGFVEDGYVDALDEFVDAGGNLVLTDTGVRLLASMDNDLVDGSQIDEGDGLDAGNLVVDTYEVARFKAVQPDDDPGSYVPALSDDPKNLEHPLLTDARPIQNQLWKVAPLGYEVNGEAPMYLLEESAFTGAAADGVPSVAGYTDGYVAAGSITESIDSGRGIHVVSSLLPPSTQKNLHPFGLQSYTVTFLGNLIFTSALGWQQVRETASETRTYGRGDEWQVEDEDGDSDDEFSAEGSRDVESTVVTGRDAVKVDVTVEDVSDEARVYDQLPDGWSLLERFSDAARVEGEEGTVRLFVREDEEDEPNGDDTVGADDDPVTFTYFAESPEGLDQSGPATFGPGRAEAAAEDSDASDTFAGETNALVFGADV